MCVRRPIKGYSREGFDVCPFYENGECRHQPKFQIVSCELCSKSLDAKVSLGGKLALLFPFNIFLHKMSPLFPDQFSCSP